jgi:hypothetical protein
MVWLKVETRDQVEMKDTSKDRALARALLEGRVKLSSPKKNLTNV